VLLDAQGEDGVVLGCVNSEVDPPPVASADKWHRAFKDGTVIEYDRTAHKLTVDAQGDMTIKASGPIKIEAQNVEVQALTATVNAQVKTAVNAPLIELNAPLTKTGPLLVAGLIQFAPPTPPVP
jgi:phage baseplate assembly protein V